MQYIKILNEVASDKYNMIPGQERIDIVDEVMEPVIDSTVDRLQEKEDAIKLQKAIK